MWLQLASNVVNGVVAAAGNKLFLRNKKAAPCCMHEVFESTVVSVLSCKIVISSIDVKSVKSYIFT